MTRTPITHAVPAEYHAPRWTPDQAAKALLISAVVNALRQACGSDGGNSGSWHAAEKAKARREAREWLWEFRADLEVLASGSAARIPNERAAFDVWLDALGERLNVILTTFSTTHDKGEAMRKARVSRARHTRGDNARSRRTKGY